jgi:hypothetical protein
MFVIIQFHRPCRNRLLGVILIWVIRILVNWSISIINENMNFTYAGDYIALLKT